LFTQKIKKLFKQMSYAKGIEKIKAKSCHLRIVDETNLKRIANDSSEQKKSV
jgi:hypothetical protein